MRYNIKKKQMKNKLCKKIIRTSDIYKKKTYLKKNQIEEK